VFTVALDLAALLLSLTFGRDHLVITAVVMVLGIVYSAGPHPWKNHPWLGFLANAAGHGPLVFLFGRTAMSLSAASSWYSSVPYFLAVGAVYLATTVPDVRGDCATGKTTAAVVLGGRPVMIIASVLVVAAIAIAGLLRDNYLLAGAVATLPFFVWSAARVGETAAGAAKAGVGLLSAAAIVAYPLYLVLLLVGFLATRRFFHWRFGMTYPTFITGR
jgi:1,4-dihydroxy-2-naphthoate octaprenyltransferase